PLVCLQVPETTTPLIPCLLTPPSSFCSLHSAALLSFSFSDCQRWREAVLVGTV
ncbi:hypothetical protein GOODEAATRI_007023, partial [Goodea atripinnis]